MLPNYCYICVMRTIPTLFLLALSISLSLEAAAQDVIVLSPGSSIQEAVDRCKGREGSTVIYLHKGVYRLEEPILITPVHANSRHSLTICSYPGEKAVVSGATTLQTRWKRHSGGIMKSRIKEGTDIDLLYGDGGMLLTMARFPNYDSSAIRVHGTSAEATSPERVKTWKDPRGGYLHAMHAHDWGDFHYVITGKDADGKLELKGGWQNNRPMGLHKDNRMVENIFEELDVAGEWYFDKASSTLYYFPLPGEDPSVTDFEAASLKNLVTLKGTAEDPVRNVTISDITFTGTARTFMEEYEPLLRSDWMIYRGGALFLEGTEDCTIAGCDLVDLGGNGVFFSKYNRRSSVRGSLLTRIGASAICFVGNPDDVRSPSFRYEEFTKWEDMDFTKGPKGEDHPVECCAYDNLIHDIGLFEKQVTGVEISMSFRITVSHNSIYDTPRSGINISEGTWGGHVIEYNDVFSTVKETGDHGSFNSWGRDRYWHPDYRTMAEHATWRPDLILADMVEPNTLRYNRFRCDRGWDIDLDDGSSLYLIHDNLCLNGGIKLREGFYRRVENNIIVNNSLHAHAWFKGCSDVFSYNIVMTPYQPYVTKDEGKTIDFNIFTDSLSIRKAWEMGTDAHSIVADVAFAAPEKGDFTVPDNSAAILQGGFMNIPMDRFGVVSTRLKALAAKPPMPIPLNHIQSGESEKWIWKSITLKSLETLGERSATGMDSERGVYVVTIDGFQSPLRDFLRPNDVIVSFDGRRIDRLDDLKEAIRKHPAGQDAELTVYRSQKFQAIVLPGLKP